MAPKRDPKPRELTAREKGILFAKNNVPKPKVKPSGDADSKQGEGAGSNAGLNQINEEEFDEMQNTIGMHETQKEFEEGYSAAPVNTYLQLEEKHRAYQEEMDAIKRLLE